MTYATFQHRTIHVADSILNGSFAENLPAYYYAVTTGIAIAHTVHSGPGNVIRLVLSDLNNINTATPALLFRFGASGDTISGLPATGNEVARGSRILLSNRPIFVRVPPNGPKTTHLHFKEIQTGAGSLLIEYYTANIQ